MAGLCAPWGPNPNRDNEDGYGGTIRTHYVSSLELNRTTNEVMQTKQQLQQGFKESLGRMRRRSPSLPPIFPRTNQNGQGGLNPHIHENEDEGETETSGYASESGGNEPRQGDYWQQQQAVSWVNEQHRHHQHSNRRSTGYNRVCATPDSTVSTPPHRWSCIGSDESQRPRWGDRGVGVGHLWEPTFHEPDCRLPQVQGSDRGTPSWLERGLSKLDDSQVLVINHGLEQTNLSCSLTGSCDTISTSNTNNECGRTFLRGQNVPLEPEVLLERERKRQKALEHQNAIRQQLEERDRKRKEECEKRAREEREEEERIRRENEREQQRLEDELRKQKEREEKEARKAKAMREALERAQKLARQEKLKTRAKHVTEIKGEVDSKRKNFNTSNEITENVPSTKPNNEIYPSESKNNQSQFSTSLPDNTDFVKINQDTVMTSQPSSNNKSNLALVATDGLALTADSLAVVLGTASSPDGSLSNLTSYDILPTPRNAVQLALLMPQTATLTGSQIVVENKLVIPTRYRHHARATQTDSEMCGSARMGRSKVKHDISNKRRERKKSASLDRPHGGCKLPLRCRSLSQPSQPRLSIEDRPKWGVNRPPMQYIKQSERDPYYQRRLRQRLLRAAMLAGSNGSGNHAGSFGSGGGGETGTESDSCTQRRIQRQRHGSSEENSRSPSPQQNSFSSRQKPLFYRQQSQKYLDRTATEKSDVSVISLDLCALDSLENNGITDGKRKNSIHKNQIGNMGSPNDRVQILSSSQNIPHRFGDSFSRRKTNDILSVSSPSFTKTSNSYSQRLLHRKSQQQVSLEIKSNGNLDQWTSQDILSQLTTLRQGLLIKQQEWETRRNQTPF